MPFLLSLHKLTVQLLVKIKNNNNNNKSKKRKEKKTIKALHSCKHPYRLSFQRDEKHCKSDL
jgi:hypothetical protein